MTLSVRAAEGAAGFLWGVMGAGAPPFAGTGMALGPATPLARFVPFPRVFVTNLTTGGAPGCLGPHPPLRLCLSRVVRAHGSCRLARLWLGGGPFLSSLWTGLLGMMNLLLFTEKDF